MYCHVEGELNTTMVVKSRSFCNKERERKKYKTFISIYLSSSCIFINGHNLQFPLWYLRIPCLLGSCISCFLNVSVSYFPICKTEIVKLILCGWADQMENTSGQGPSFTIEEYHIGKVIKKYPSKLVLIENCVFNRGHGHTNQLLHIVEKIT